MRLLVLAVISVAAATGVAAMHEPVIAEPEWTPVIESISLSTPFFCLYVCTEGGCGADQHQNHSLCYPAPTGCTHGGDQHECAWALHDCDGSQHKCSEVVPVPEATAQLEPLRDPAFWEALQRADGRTLRTFLENNAAVTSVNTERRSLQVRGCNDEVVANIPLTPGQLATLSH